MYSIIGSVHVWIYKGATLFHRTKCWAEIKNRNSGVVMKNRCMGKLTYILLSICIGRVLHHIWLYVFANNLRACLSISISNTLRAYKAYKSCKLSYNFFLSQGKSGEIHTKRRAKTALSLRATRRVMTNCHIPITLKITSFIRRLRVGTIARKGPWEWPNYSHHSTRIKQINNILLICGGVDGKLI